MKLLRDLLWARAKCFSRGASLSSAAGRGCDPFKNTQPEDRTECRAGCLHSQLDPSHRWPLAPEGIHNPIPLCPQISSAEYCRSKEQGKKWIWRLTCVTGLRFGIVRKFLFLSWSFPILHTSRGSALLCQTETSSDKCLRAGFCPEPRQWRSRPPQAWSSHSVCPPGNHRCCWLGTCLPGQFMSCSKRFEVITSLHLPNPKIQFYCYS